MRNEELWQLLVGMKDKLQESFLLLVQMSVAVINGQNENPLKKNNEQIVAEDCHETWYSDEDYVIMRTES